jgi:hypothetical protein
MKREYSKPTIHVETLALDMPIATSCDNSGDYGDLHAQGWFNASGECALDAGDWLGDLADLGNTICYHTSVKNAFVS